MPVADTCAHCGENATRPDVVWIGEYPYHLEEIANRIETVEIFAAIGSSGQVHPAANFVQEAAA